MPAAFDGKAERAVDFGPHIIVVDRELGQRGRDVEQRKGMRGGAQIVAGASDHRAEPLEDLQLQPQRAVAGIGDLGFDLAEFGGGEADLAGQRLAMDEGRVQRRRHQLVAVLRRHLDEIAEHIVVADLEALDAGVVGVARLHRGDDEARGVAQVAGLVERGLIAFANEAAVALDQRQLLGQRALEFARQLARRAAQRRHHRSDILRRMIELVEPRQRLVGGEDAVAQACEIARAAAADRQPRQRARHVGRAAQDGADIVARRAVRDEGRRRHRAAARSRRCRSAAPPAVAPAAAIRPRSRCSRWRRAASRAVRRRASASVRDWRGWRDRSPWWCRRLRATAATAAGVCRPGCGRYR